MTPLCLSQSQPFFFLVLLTFKSFIEPKFLLYPRFSTDQLESLVLVSNTKQSFKPLTIRDLLNNTKNSFKFVLSFNMVWGLTVFPTKGVQVNVREISSLQHLYKSEEKFSDGLGGSPVSVHVNVIFNYRFGEKYNY